MDLQSTDCMDVDNLDVYLITDCKQSIFRVSSSLDETKMLHSHFWLLDNHNLVNFKGTLYNNMA